MRVFAIGKVFFVVFIQALVSFCAHAMVSTDTLPENIDSPSFRYGHIDGLNQKYLSDGNLVRLGDSKSVSFDAEHLEKFNSEAKKLVQALNRFGSQNMGNNFDLGVLRIDTQPVVNYFAPVYARGITDRWTVGMGLPVVTYQNKISMAQQFSNAAYYKQQFGGLSPELDQALSTNLATATNAALTAKGYKALANKNETFLGDTQIVSLYKLYADPSQTLLYGANLGLPTGPHYNPDDLAEMNVFGRTTLTHTLAYSHKLGSRWTVVPYISYLMNAPDQVTERVPVNEDDVLPDDSTKENVQRKIGNTAYLGAGAYYDFNDSITVGAGYETSQKDADEYSGSKNSRYDLLSVDTAMLAQRWKAQFSYSSVSSYFRKAAVLPMIVSLELTDIFAGTNVERQFTQELNVMLFF